MNKHEFPAIQRPGLAHYVDRIVNRQVYSFSRWGDGEWRAALHRRSPTHANCDKHRFFKPMNQQLEQVLLDQPAYEMGIQALALKCYGPAIRNFIRKRCPKITWHDSDVFHKASVKGQLAPLLSALREAPLLMVGPAYLQKIEPLLKYEVFVNVPQRNCYRELDRIRREVLAAAKDMPQPFVCSISASMPAEILIHQLYPSLGRTAFLIDFGSLYDPFVGNNTRGYHRAMSRETRKANLEGVQ